MTNDRDAIPNLEVGFCTLGMDCILLVHPVLFITQVNTDRIEITRFRFGSRKVLKRLLDGTPLHDIKASSWRFGHTVHRIPLPDLQEVAWVEGTGRVEFRYRSSGRDWMRTSFVENGGSKQALVETIRSHSEKSQLLRPERLGFWTIAWPVVVANVLIWIHCFTCCLLAHESLLAPPLYGLIRLSPLAWQVLWLLVGMISSTVVLAAALFEFQNHSTRWRLLIGPTDSQTNDGLNPLAPPNPFRHTPD